MYFNDFIGTMTICTDVKTPENWLDCDGKIMPIQGNEAIFSLLETRYGGDGYKDFALPKVPNLGNARYIICVKGDFPSRS